MHPRGECQRKYGSDAITERMICGGVPGGNKDACQVPCFFLVLSVSVTV